MGIFETWERKVYMILEQIHMSILVVDHGKWGIGHMKIFLTLG